MDNRLSLQDDPANPSYYLLFQWNGTLAAWIPLNLPCTLFHNAITNQNINSLAEWSLISGIAANLNVTGWTIQAGLLGARGILRGTVKGFYINTSGAGSNLTVRIKFGNVTLWSIVIATINSVATSPFALDFIMNNNGINGQNVHGKISGLTAAAVADATGTHQTLPLDFEGILGVQNSNLQQHLDVTVQHSVALATIETDAKVSTLELVNYLRT